MNYKDVLMFPFETIEILLKYFEALGHGLFESSFLIVGIYAILYILSGIYVFIMKYSGASNNRLDTSEKAIERYKRQYVSGDISLQEFEDKTYETIEVNHE